MNPTILHFSRTGNAMKMLLFLGFAVLAFGLTYLLLEERQAVPPPTQVLPGGLELPMPAPRPIRWRWLKYRCCSWLAGSACSMSGAMACG